MLTPGAGCVLQPFCDRQWRRGVYGWEGRGGVDDDDYDVVVAGIEGRGPWEGVLVLTVPHSERKATYTGVGTLTRPVCSTIDSFAIDVPL